MKVKFDKSSVDISQLETPEDMFSYLKGIPDQEKILVLKGRRLSRDFAGFEKFDMLLPKEVSLLNLMNALSKAQNELQDELFPSEVAKSYAYLSAQKQAKNYKLPPVDQEKFECLNKLRVFYHFTTVMFDTSVHSRLGYNLNLTINPDGSIYALSDLRDLHKASF